MDYEFTQNIFHVGLLYTYPEIRGSHCEDYEYYCLLGYVAV